MEKTNRKILLSVFGLVAIMCFMLSAVIGFPTSVKATNTLSIINVEQTFLETYNSASGGYRSEYVVTFKGDADVLASHTDGEDITATYATFGTHVKINGKELSALQERETGSGYRYKIYKESANAIKIETGRPIGYAKFEFLAGLSVGDSVMEETVTYYENPDWSFTTTAPEFRFQTAMHRPGGGFYQFTFSHTGSGSVGGNTLKGIKVDGQLITESLDSVTLSAFGRTVVQPYNTQANWGGDYDPGTSGTAFHLFFLKSYVDARLLVGDMEITFPAGFTIGSQSLAKEQTLVLAQGSNLNDWNKYTCCFTLKETGEGETPDITPTEGVIKVKEVRKILLEPYNSNPGYRSEYIIEFENLGNTLSGYALGADLTSAFPTFGTNVKVNGMPLTGIQDSYKIYKAGDNAVKVETGRPMGYAKFELIKGLTVGGFALTEDYTCYENQDYTFTTEAPAFKIHTIWGRPNTNATYYQFTISHTGLGSITPQTIKGIKINGQMITESADSVVLSEFGKTAVKTWNNAGVIQSDYGNDGDKGTAGTAFHFYIAKTLFDNEVIITFPIGFTIGANSLTKEQTFVAGKAMSFDDWANIPTFVEEDDLLLISNIEQLSEVGASTSEYEITFNCTEDVLSQYDNGDVTAKMKEYSNIFNKFKYAGKSLADIATSSTVKLTKIGANKLKLETNYYAPYVNISTDVNLRVGNKISADSQVFEFEVDRETTKLLGITSETNYGMMSEDVQLRFTLRFDNLGLFKDMPLGTNLTTYFDNIAFKDKILINGISLTTITTTDAPKLSVYRGSKDAEIYKGVANGIGKPYGTALEGKYDVSNAIEVILSATQIFDYEITVLDGLAFGDVEVAEGATYQKLYDETFALVTEKDTAVKPIAIREVPYGAMANTRAISFVFNNPIAFKSDADLVNAIKFGGQVLNKEEDCFITIKGGCYVNGEARYGKRTYTILVDAREWAEFVLSENPTIEIPSVDLLGGGALVGTTMVLDKGTWVPDGTDLSDYEAPAFVEVLQHGNQYIYPDGSPIHDVKLIRIIANYGYNHYVSASFLNQNLYFNGKKVVDYDYVGGKIETETKWEGIAYHIYVNNDIRNYETGFDVIYIPRGTVISGNRIIDKDTYIYSVQNKAVRDGAGNWAWEYFLEAPALKVFAGGETVVSDDTITATINFDRVVAKNDVKFGVYNEVDVSSMLKVNGKSIAEYTGENKFVWTDNGIKLTLNKSEIADLADGYLKVNFANGFTTPLGYKLDADADMIYSINDNVWATSFEKLSAATFAATKPTSLGGIAQIRVGDKEVDGNVVPKLGYKIDVKFDKNLVGATKFAGANNAYHLLLRNITAPYADLIKLTELDYAGNIAGVGYEYPDYIVQRVINYGIRDSIMDKITLAGETVREILAKETAYVSLENYPIQIDLHKDTLSIIVQEDSVIYEKIKEGLVLQIASGLVFEANSRTATNSTYRLTKGENGALEFTEYVFASGITVVNRKATYKQGEDLDLSRIHAYFTYSNGEKGDNITITADMISGYDKNKIGEQTVTVTVDGLSDTFIVNVTANQSSSDNGGNTVSSSGCGAIISGNFAVLAIALVVCVAIICIRKTTRKD